MVSGETRIDLLRHGEHRLGNVVCGVTDPALTETGWSQLEQRCRNLAETGMSWDACISSPRKRCAEFAEQICEKHSLDLVIDDGFGEVDFGCWEGLSFDEISEKYPGQWKNWIENPDVEAPHGGESYGPFLNRVGASWDSVMESHRNRNILLLGHGGVIRAVFARAFGLNPDSLFRFNVPHACHSRIISYHAEGEPDWCQLDSHNGQ